MTLTNFRKLGQEILEKIDLAAEYERLGLKFSAPSPRANGWREAHAMGREDRKPSAAVCFGSGNLGTYKDLGGAGESCSFFDFAAKYGSHRDWRAARRHYAKQVGLLHKLPKGDVPECPEDKLEWTRHAITNPFEVRGFCRRYGVTHHLLRELGCRIARYPKGSFEPYYVIGFPVHGPGGMDEPPRGWIIASSDGRPIHRYRGEADAEPTKRLVLGTTGLVGGIGLRGLESARVVIKCEGLTDMLAVQAAIPPDRRSEFAVLTNACGTHETTLPGEVKGLFADKEVWILHDCDVPGQEGADLWSATLQPVAKAVRKIVLPYAIEEKHGKDIRDWFRDGQTFAQLEELASQTDAIGPDEARKQIQKQIQVSNDEIVQEGDSKKAVPLSMGTILETIREKTGGWPRVVGKSLFVDSGGKIQLISKPSALMGYIGSITGKPPRFNRGSEFHSKDEVFSELERTSESYLAIETIPHEPAIADHYYSHPEIKPGDGSTLEKLLDFFSPETPVDRDLIKALFMTIVWGGPGGLRPAFLLTAKEGQGVGKSTTAKIVGEIFSWNGEGSYEVTPHDNIEAVKTRMLTPDQEGKRVVRLDNIKTHRLSWAELEGLITSPFISGRQNYVGNASRPNVFTYILTLNGASLSTDMAQRCVIINLKRPQYAGRWEASLREFFRANRLKIFGDLVACMRSERRELARYTRWGEWEYNVLERLPDPSETQAVILERQRESNVEADEATVIEEFFQQRLEELNYQTEIDHVFIPSRIATEWVGKAKNERVTTVGVGRLLKMLIEKGDITRLYVNPSRSNGRGFVWWNGDASGAISRRMDIEERIIREQDQDTERKAAAWKRGTSG